MPVVLRKEHSRTIVKATGPPLLFRVMFHARTFSEARAIDFLLDKFIITPLIWQSHYK
jgi:hypothetical protein